MSISESVNKFVEENLSKEYSKYPTLFEEAQILDLLPNKLFKDESSCGS